MKETIKQLEKEIKYWNDIEKQIDNCPKEDYKEFTRLERLWINCPLDELKTKLRTLQEVCKEIKKVKNPYPSDVFLMRIARSNLQEDLLKKFQGEEI